MSEDAPATPDERYLRLHRAAMRLIAHSQASTGFGSVNTVVVQSDDFHDLAKWVVSLPTPPTFQIPER